MNMKEIEAEAKIDLMREKEDIVKRVVRRILNKIDRLNREMKEVEKEYSKVMSMTVDECFNSYGKGEF